jgi:hypothetical protein
MSSLTFLRHVNQKDDKINDVGTHPQRLSRCGSRFDCGYGSTGETITGQEGEYVEKGLVSDVCPILGSLSDSGRLSAGRQDRIAVAGAAALARLFVRAESARHSTHGELDLR